MRDSDKLRGPNNELPEEPARPVEDREPVGPYAPTRAEGGPISGGLPLHLTNERVITGLRKVAATVGAEKVRHLVEAGLTPTAAAAHIVEVERIRADADTARARIKADQDHYRDGFRAGVKIGAAEQSARDLDETWETTETLRPESYDVAERALDYATRLVEPIKSAPLVLDEEFGPVTSAYVRLTTELASGLYGWLTQFTEPDQPEGRGQSASGMIVDEVQNWPVGERVDISKMPRCPQPQCGVLLDSTGACTDPWCPSGGAVVGDPVIERVATPEDQQFRPMPEPEQQQACPECRSGKHDNCGGVVVDQTDTYVGCPCSIDTHPESLPGPDDVDSGSAGRTGGR